MTERKLTITTTSLGGFPMISCIACGRRLWDGDEGDAFSAEELLRTKCKCEKAGDGG